MPAREPFIPRRVDGDLELGPLLQIAFPTAGVPRAVAHGLETVPDGFLPATWNGPIITVDEVNWTAASATLQAELANTIVVGRFFTWAAPVTPEIA